MRLFCNIPISYIITIKKTFSLYQTESHSDLVDDLYQDFFLSLVRDNFAKLRQFRGERGCSLASWLRVIASRLTIDFLRKQGVSTAKILDNLPSDQSDPHESLIDDEQKRLLSRVLETLSPRDRLFVQLCFQKTLSPKEIAAILQTSLSFAYTQKSRILNKLRETLRKAGAL